MKKLLSHLLLGSITLIVLFVGIEVLLRVTHLFGARIAWSRPDPLIGWRFVPSGQFQSLEETTQLVPFETNRFGWKDKEWNFEKSPGHFRIAVLGDSYPEALQVEREKNFLSLAEIKLNQTGMTTEWMNFGRSGASQTEEFLILQKEALSFRPDLVILTFFPVNDIDDISPETSADSTRPFFKLDAEDNLQLDTHFNQTRAYRLKSWIAPLKEKSVLISLLSQRLSLMRQTRHLKTIRSDRTQTSAEKIHGYLSLCTVQPNPLYQKNYSLNKRLIREMAELSKKNGIPLMLVSLDIPAYLPNIEEELTKTDSSFDPLFFEKDLEAFAESLEISYLGLQSSFRKAYEADGKRLHSSYWGTDGRPAYWEYGAHSGHWNEEGHQLVAEIIAEKVRNLRAIEQPS